MTHPYEGEAASRELIRELRDAAEQRLLSDIPRTFVPDAAGGDPIPWCDYQIEAAPDAPEQRRH